METNWKEWIKYLDFKSTTSRRNKVIKWLIERNVEFTLHHYKTGTNVIVKLGEGPKYFAISSHLDRVRESGGANDNASAMAVCLHVIDEYLTRKDDRSLMIFFFDEEETGLKGSRAYVNEIGTEQINSLINMELVGNGEYGILWPVKKHSSLIVQQLLQTSHEDQFFKAPFLLMPDFPLYYSDADAFLESGFKNAITITCLSKNDFELAKRYIEIKENGADDNELYSMISRAEIMQYYHSKLDNSGMINNLTIYSTANLILDSVILIKNL